MRSYIKVLQNSMKRSSIKLKNLTAANSSNDISSTGLGANIKSTKSSSKVSSNFLEHLKWAIKSKFFAVSCAFC